MVHALSEIHRVLKPNETLLDLRPLEDSWSVEVVSSAGWQVAGRLIDMPQGVADDAAANKAMRDVEASGWFIQKISEEFPYFYSWDTPTEMKAFMENEWEGFEKLDEEVPHDCFIVGFCQCRCTGKSASKNACSGVGKVIILLTVQYI